MKVTQYRIELTCKKRKIIWDYGEARGFNFTDFDLHVSGVGIEAYYPLRFITELHLTTRIVELPKPKMPRFDKVIESIDT